MTVTEVAASRSGPTCPHCAQKPRNRTGDYVSLTCGASECQEAEYRANRDRNASRRRRK
jgi:hypothetical protein